MKYKIYTLKQYIEIIDEFESKYMFRGQANEEWTLKPSISRDERTELNERKMYNEMLNLKPNDFLGYKNNISKIAKMQHYGLYTRLLDITNNPLVALYFAISSKSELNKNGKVFVLEGQQCNAQIEQVEFMTLICFKEINNIYQMCDFLKDNYNKEIEPEDLRKLISSNIYITKDIQGNDRLIAQDGGFILFGNQIDNKGNIQNINEFDYSDIKHEIIIDSKSKETISMELDLRYGINKHYLFPEIDYAAQYLNKKYSQKNRYKEKKYYIFLEDVSTIQVKRYAAKVLLNDVYNKEDITNIIVEVSNEVKSRKINEEKDYSESLRDEHVQVIWLYFANSLIDIDRANWICRTQWIDNKLPVDQRPILLDFNDKIHDILIKWNDDYESMKKIFKNDISKKDIVIKETERKVNEIITYFNEFTKMYKSLIIDQINEKNFLESINNLYEEVNKLYLEATNLPIGDETLNNYCDISDLVFADIDNLYLICKGKKEVDKALIYQIEKQLEIATKNLKKYEVELNRVKDKSKIL